ncbi:MAG: peptidylprolyl isomerase [Paracoccaceae bacterium]|nr:peptidylprolyl isomerase [Paracoccaceae bacterium]
MSLANHLLHGVALAALLALPAAAQEAAEAPEAPDAAAEAPAQNLSADTVVATVNGVDITLGHMIVMRARLPEQYQALPDDMLFSGVLDQIIQQIALGAGMEGKLSKGSELALENERRAFIAGEALGGVADGAVTDEALQALYTERFADAAPSQEYNASHILVATEEEAAALKAEVDGGADFAELARTRSTGPSGPNGGDLGWFTEGMMVEPFEQALLLLKPGEVSGPVQTQFGWHVIMLNEVRLKEAPPLDEVRGELSEELQRQAIDAAIAAATEAAEIVRNDEGIDPTVLRSLDLVSQ